MSKKKSLAQENADRIQGALAIALVSAPSPYPWERTVAMSTLVEEVRAMLGIAEARTKSLLTAIKKIIAQWLPSGWITHDKNKDCVTLNKEAEPIMNQIGNKLAFGT